MSLNEVTENKDAIITAIQGDTRFMSRITMVLSVLYLLIGYAFVSLIDFVRIRKIPLDVALKNVE